MKAETIPVPDLLKDKEILPEYLWSKPSVGRLVQSAGAIYTEGVWIRREPLVLHERVWITLS